MTPASGSVAIAAGQKTGLRPVRDLCWIRHGEVKGERDADPE